MTRSASARALLIGLAVLGADQLTKAIARGSIDRGESVDLVLGIDLVNVRNDGIAFGLFGGSAVIVLLITLLAGAALLYYVASQPERTGGWLALGLLGGGAAGNLIDRLAAGEVTDFIDLPAWPAFNIADVGITAGIVALLIAELWPGASRPRG